MEYLKAYLCGGIQCIIGQLLIDKTPLTPAKILVSYVTAGVILSGLGLSAPRLALHCPLPHWEAERGP